MSIERVVEKLTGFEDSLETGLEKHSKLPDKYPENKLIVFDDDGTLKLAIKISRVWYSVTLSEV